MAHKYNLFLLDLVDPRSFKDHCRSYIGVTERAVTTKMCVELPLTGHSGIDALAAELQKGSHVDRVRAHIVASYFVGMKDVFATVRKVLKKRAMFILALGTTNQIRGRTVQTADWLVDVAETQGFHLDDYFFHRLERRRIKFSRNVTAGKIEHEVILILRAS
jgi:hypothetical protein